MNLGEFREVTRNLPDDTDLLGDPGDGDVCELDASLILPPSSDHSNAVLLRLGQQVYLALDIETRIDVARWL